MQAEQTQLSLTPEDAVWLRELAAEMQLQGPDELLTIIRERLQKLRAEWPDSFRMLLS